MESLSELERELVEVATSTVERWGRSPLHTVAAAALDASGRILTGMNLYHFLGGPCAEVTVMAKAASETVHPLVTMVAVGDDERGVIPPCGKCRQVMIDRNPHMKVIVPTVDGLTVESIATLLPVTYRRDGMEGSSSLEERNDL